MKRIEMSSDGFSDDQIIELRKIINDQIKNARKESRHNKCLLCDKEGGFCDSHIIPQFCLKNIAWNGKLNSFNTLIGSDFLKKILESKMQVYSILFVSLVMVEYFKIMKIQMLMKLFLQQLL